MKKTYQKLVAPVAFALLFSAVLVSCNEEKKETTIEKKETIEIKKEATEPMDSGNTRPVVPAGSAPSPAPVN